MYETPERALFTTGDVKKKLRGGERRQLDFKNLYLLSRESPNSPWRTDSSRSVRASALSEMQKLKFLVLGSVSRCGRRQVVLTSGYVDGKEEGGGGAAERRQVGWSVTASHWCALSYVGINHDSEMTYFLTPQTNSTFNRSQGLCQTTFSPRSLSKVASGRVGLPRHNAEDVRFLSQAPSAALL